MEPYSGPHFSVMALWTAAEVRGLVMFQGSLYLKVR